MIVSDEANYWTSNSFLALISSNIMSCANLQGKGSLWMFDQARKPKVRS